MSRIARNPIALPKGVEISIDAQNIQVKGPLGAIARAMDRQPDRVLLLDPDPGLARPAQPLGLGVEHDLVLRYFFFVSFKTIVSFA